MMFAFGVVVGVGVLFGVGVGVADMSTTLGLSLDDIVRYFFVATLGFGHGEIWGVGVGE